MDLSPYVTSPVFDIVAGGNMTLAGNVDFDGLSASKSIIFSLVAGNQITIAAGATINANVANFELQTPQTITLDGVNMNNLIGNTAIGTGAGFVMRNNANLETAANLTLRTVGDISISHATLVADSMFLTSAQGNLGIDSTLANLNSIGVFAGDQGLTVSGSTINANSFSGVLAFKSAHGSVNITGTSIQAGLLTVNSGDGILLDGTGQTFSSTAPASTPEHPTGANFTAANLAAINNADLTAFQNVNVTANTINLHDVAFDGTVSLKSLLGQWHNSSSVFGYVNDLGGNTYHGQAISAADGFSGTIGGTGITISKR